MRQFRNVSFDLTIFVEFALGDQQFGKKPSDSLCHRRDVVWLTGAHAVAVPLPNNVSVLDDHESVGERSARIVRDGVIGPVYHQIRGEQSVVQFFRNWMDLLTLSQRRGDAGEAPGALKRPPIEWIQKQVVWGYTPVERGRKPDHYAGLLPSQTALRRIFNCVRGSDACRKCKLVAANQTGCRRGHLGQRRTDRRRNRENPKTCSQGVHADDSSIYRRRSQGKTAL